MNLCLFFIFGGFAFITGYLIGRYFTAGPRAEKEAVRSEEGCIINDYIDFLNYDGTLVHRDA